MAEMNPNSSVNEKLRSFTDIALREAYRRKNEIIDNTEAEVKQTLKETEIELLENAYRSVQTGARQNRRELNEAVSKALVDGKRRMFDKRREIIEDVFRQVRSQLKEYAETPEYPKKMTGDILDCVGRIGDEGYRLEVIPKEKDLFKGILKEMGIEAEVEEGSGDLGGGFIIYGKEKRIRIDCSFAAGLKEAREKFLEMCRLPIGDRDLLDDGTE